MDESFLCRFKVRVAAFRLQWIVVAAPFIFSIYLLFRHRDSSGRHRARRGGAQQQEGDISQKDAEGPPLLDSKEVSVVLKLIKFTYFTQKSILAKVVFNLSSHPEQRTHVLKGIVHPLAKCVTASIYFVHMLFVQHPC